MWVGLDYCLLEQMATSSAHVSFSVHTNLVYHLNRFTHTQLNWECFSQVVQCSECLYGRETQVVHGFCFPFFLSYQVSMYICMLLPLQELLTGSYNWSASFFFTLGKQKNAYSLHVLQKPDQILAQSSDVSLGATGVNPSSLVNQFRDNKISRPVLSIDTAPTGMMRTRYNSTAYSFPGNSGS